jgi:hypothetical protein
MIDRHLAKGSLLRIHAGVYAVGHSASIPLGAETPALLALGPGAVLSHEHAAALWRLRQRPPAQAPIHVTVLGSGTHKRPGIAVHRTRALTQRDLRTRDRLPVTSPARTLLDLAATVTTRELERAIDEALVTRIMSGSQLAELVHRN